MLYCCRCVWPGCNCVNHAPADRHPACLWVGVYQVERKISLESVAALPLVLPLDVLGFHALIVLGPRGVIGNWHRVSWVYPSYSPSVDWFWLLAQQLPFAVSSRSLNSFESLDRLVAECVCTSRRQSNKNFSKDYSASFLARPPTSLTILSFAHTLGEFGVVLMVGGNLLALRVYRVN